MKRALIILFVALLNSEYFVFSVLAESSAAASASPVASQSAQPTVAPSDRSIVLSQAVDLTFRPENVFFFVELRGSEGEIAPFSRIRGLLINYDSDDNKSSNYQVVAGVRLGVPARAKEAVYHLLFIGKDRQFHIVPGFHEAIPPQFTAEDDIRRALLQMRESQRSLEVQTKAQEQSLERLREDAGVIGNLQKIVELKEEVQQVQKDDDRLQRDVKSLEEALSRARAKPLPRSYARWEVQLTEQLAELAERSKHAESDEFSRKSRSVGSLQKKLAVIEEARQFDIDTLQGELVRLRKERLRLEKQSKK